MSKINFNRNIFLEKEELNRLQRFLEKTPVTKAFLANSTSYGIIDTSGTGESVDFLLEEGTSSGTVKIAQASTAIDKDGLIIEQSAIDNIAVPDDGNWHWFYIEHTYTNYEVGTVSVGVNGNLTGSGTKFTETLRGHSTNVPVRVVLNSTNNIAVYTVVDVINDTNAILEGESFVAETGKQFRVLGSIPFGETVTDDHKLGLYSYDTCNLVSVTGTPDNGISPLTLTAGKQFFLGLALNRSGVVVILDGRSESFWQYYIRGVGNKLSAEPSDWTFSGTQKTSARNSIDVYSKQEVENLLNVTEVGWTAMTRGIACSEVDFDIKISRVGKQATVTGYFTLSGSTSIGATIASLPISTLAGTAGVTVALTNRIYGQTIDVSSSDRNRGASFYVDQISESSSDLQIKLLSFDQTTNLKFTLTFNLI